MIELGIFDSGKCKMIPKDKYGNIIYENTYNIIFEYGNVLINNGYIESKKSPNLFFKIIKGMVIFADLRGTYNIKIWDDPRPLIYSKYKDNKTTEKWRIRRIIKEECESLNKEGCPTRFSFYSECEIEGLMSKDEDGYCIICGKDFQDDGKYCSEECEIIAKKRELAKYITSSPFCEICKKRIVKPEYYEKIKDILSEDLGKIETEHHISYKDNETITVCSSCHGKIHHSKDLKYNKYRPDSKRPINKSGYYTTCELCGKKAKYNENCEHQLCYKCNHRCIKCGKFTQRQGGICYSCLKKLEGKKSERLIYKYDPIKGKSNYREYR